MIIQIPDIRIVEPEIEEKYRLQIAPMHSKLLKYNISKGRQNVTLLFLVTTFHPPVLTHGGTVDDIVYKVI